MSFLQPWLLAALPLVALPIIIHLINQRRFQTIRWAAMMFLLAANRMSRGYARLRQWLIMAFRMLAIACLVFAISRPLASGWLGLTAGGKADTTIILIDRSPSMQQRHAGGGESKLETGRQQLATALNTLGSSRWVLIDSAKNAPQEIESPDALLSSPATEPTSASTDLPALLQAAHEYITANQVGRTEIWICSDVRENDWSAESGRWATLREAFLAFPQTVRFHLLAYTQPAPGNVSVRVTAVRRQQADDSTELLVSLKLKRETEDTSRFSIPVQFEIDGARSELTIDMEGDQFELKEHRIPLETSQKRGWGRVSIPADANPADNDYFFVFDEPVRRRTIIVVDDERTSRPLQLAAGISPDPAVQCASEVVPAEQLAAVDWEGVSLLLWQGPLPEATAASHVQAFVDRGGRTVFFPPQVTGDTELFGVRWGDWVESENGVAVENWRGDQDLLAHTQSGAALPVGKLQIWRHCGLASEVTALATLQGGSPLLARSATPRGGAYFCATTPAAADSSLAADGVALYVFVQRALAGGAEALASTQHVTAGDKPLDDPATWKRLAGGRDALSTEFPFHGGVYVAGDRLLAVNRAPAEDEVRGISNERVAGLFRGLDFSRVDDRAGSAASLIQEVWRLFLASVIVALIVEAALCLPRLARPAGGVS